MKHFKVLMAVFTSLCILAACGVAEDPTHTTTISQVSTETTVPEETTQVTTTPAETTVPPTTQATTPPPSSGVNPTTEVIKTGDGYRIIREDHSYRNEAGQVLISHYFDYVELTGSFAGAQKINAQMKQLAEDFFWSDEELTETATGDFAPDPSSPFSNTKSSSVTYISDRCLCVAVGMDWWMGGVHNGGSDGYVFDLRTGEKATLASLTGGDPAELEARLKEIAWEQISNDEYDEPWEGSYEKLSAYTLDTFDYSIIDGQIVLFFDVYEFFPGAHGPVTVHTGIYV